MQMLFGLCPFPRAVVSGALLAYSRANLLPAFGRVQSVSDCEESGAKFPAAHRLPYRWAYSDRVYPRPVVYMRLVVFDEIH